MEKAFNKLVKDVQEAGTYAARQQNIVTRSIKKDGSILTKTDTELDKLLTGKINEYFPNALVVSEENPLPELETSHAEWIFTLDPIDGTDSYSQGMPGWCIAIGILNKNFEPVGTIIYAPRWGTEATKGNLITLIPGGGIKINSKNFDSSNLNFTQTGQLMIGSGLHRLFNFSSFTGKIRVSGSAIISIAAALIHIDVNGSVIAPCYIWDVAAAHAVIKKAGMDLEYYSGKQIDYRDLVNRAKAPDCFISGSPETLELIRRHFKLINK